MRMQREHGGANRELHLRHDHAGLLLAAGNGTRGVHPPAEQRPVGDPIGDEAPNDQSMDRRCLKCGASCRICSIALPAGVSSGKIVTRTSTPPTKSAAIDRGHRQAASVTTTPNAAASTAVWLLNSSKLAPMATTPIRTALVWRLVASAAVAGQAASSNTVTPRS